MPSLQELQLLQWFYSPNEEDEREVLIKLSISSVVIRSRKKKKKELIICGVCVYGRKRNFLRICCAKFAGWNSFLKIDKKEMY